MSDLLSTESTRTWLFQAQPQSFAIDEFLATNPKELPWLTRQYAPEIRRGDQVFIWRAIGGGDRAKSGIIAEAQVLTEALESPEDPAAIAFWRGPSNAVGAQLRVRLRLLRVATQRQILQRDWLSADPILGDLAIFKMAQNTNFRVTSRQAARLRALWARVGHDWSYPESVAGLWAYVQTVGGEVSRRPGSPVANVSLAIGRVVTGVYNKVMNFRSIDPRDHRTGMSGVGAMDRKVWALFYDVASGVIRSQALEAEYRRFWQAAVDDLPPQPEGEQEQEFEREVHKLSTLSLDDLAAILAAAPSDAARDGLVTRIQQFKRDPLIAAFARVRASFRCEVPGCTHPVFEAKDGKPYSEVHHIEPLSEGGEDKVANVACIRPAHHREVHHGKGADAITTALTQLRQSPTR